MAKQNNARKLIEEARRGKRLTSVERRYCVAYIMATEPDMTNIDMAELFACSESLIRQDKFKVRTERSKQIRDGDVRLLVGDIVVELERQIQDIESSKRQCKKGTRPYVEHCKAIFSLRRDGLAMLQNIGWYPKQLGNMTVSKFVYEAIVDERTGAVNTVPSDFDVEDASFEDVTVTPMLEAPSETLDTTTDSKQPVDNEITT